MKTIELLSSAWFGDKPLTINFHSSWDIMVAGNKKIPPLTKNQIKDAFNHPIGSPGLLDLVRTKKRVAVIIDDITRPTPADKIVPFVLEELQIAGFPFESIIVVIASGTHKKASTEEIEKKIGKDLAAKITVIPHDDKKDLVYLGKSSRGTPLYVNHAVIECDFKIGIGCIYPHPAAGFSGGGKIIMPGIMGAETVRYMHDYMKGAVYRGGSLDTELRLEIEEVATKVGLDFMVNVVLNQKREVAGLFAGDKILAHRQGVKFATEVYSVQSIQNADVIISDMYPFDTSLQFAYDRGFWPIMNDNDSTKIAIAACPMGLGYHGLSTLSTSIWSRVIHRLKYFQIKDVYYLVHRLRSLKKMFARRKQDFFILSGGIMKEELEKVFPKSRLFSNWDAILRELESKYKDSPVRVAIYQCSPLLIPVEKGG